MPKVFVGLRGVKPAESYNAAPKCFQERKVKGSLNHSI